jgi:hypothetical protein
MVSLNFKSAQFAYTNTNNNQITSIDDSKLEVVVLLGQKTGVNFTTILCAAFMYVSCAHSFFVLMF